MRTFEHPSGNGYTETVDKKDAVLILLFGAMYLCYKRAWGAGLLAAATTAGVALLSLYIIGATDKIGGGAATFVFWWAITPYCFGDEIPKAYLKRGWKEQKPSEIPQT
ncbi:hypothetical protein [Nitrospirillum iridis]|uniref:Transmembrane protein n=1 Tax=Nitrospirillum iridis TaxID=765888 RepID=A0A7X0AYJ7_9PROT|nr:hypothetical protein [Nitrospirillum iridis]MBB6251440.1 hypothetical protein [Nitrospirillum iridis]